MQEHNTKSNDVDEYAQIRKILEDADDFFEKHPRDSLVVKLPKDSKTFRETLIYIASMKYGFLVENDKIKVTKKGKIKTTKIGYFFDCKKIV